jgi:hypothetical protein
MPNPNSINADTVGAAGVAPAYLSGVRETAPASWLVMAIFARLGALGLDAPRQGHEDIDAARPKPQKLPAWAQNRRPLLIR